MKISIIIANYNYAEFIAECINSVLNQTYENIECVVVDDGSTDGSRDIISRFGGIKTIFHSNRGQALSLIAGMNASSGDAILFLDSDDWLAPNACQRLVEIWEADVVAISYRLQVVLDRKLTSEILPRQDHVTSDPVSFIFQFGDIPVAPNSGNAYLRSAVDQIVSSASGLTGNTIDCWLALCSPLLGRVIYTPDVLGYYRVHSSNISRVGRGLDFKQVKWLIFNFYWAQETARRIAEKLNVAIPSYRHLIGPYYLKYYLLFGDFPLEPFEIPKHPRASVASEAIHEFLHYPFIGFAKRFANVAAVALIYFSPSIVRSWLARKVYKIVVPVNGSN
ncbi:glycosyltransferase family 2 protein [Bradyrhizobium sp. BR13661]|jgi:glycosyltransferase involved in cell wall biosynthesis|nr:glycosyltransferase family 2 protein [Bradyrhizobium sp. BR13661]MDH6263556.1 glycosyltransferase involved in cell wall biosynthesis [Bradyrhizobium sp. BR13661]